MPDQRYVPFDAGSYPVTTRTAQPADGTRNRVFPCEIWSPESEFCPGAQAHDLVRGLTLAHLDATLRRSAAAERFLAADADAALAAPGVDAAADRGY